MRADLARRELHDRRRGLIGWTLGLATYLLFITSAYASIGDLSEMQELVDSYPDEMMALMGVSDFDLGSAAGYFGAELYSFPMPLFLLIYAIGFGASAIAGEQREGRLDLVLSYPVTRRRLVLERFAVMGGALVLLGTVIAVSLLVGSVAFDYSIDAGRVVMVNLATVLLGTLFGAVAMLVGALTLQRGTAIAVGSAAAGVAYLVNSLGLLVSWMETPAELSPFHWYAGSEILRSGPNLAGLAALAVTSVVAIVATVVVFERRDLVS